MGIRDSFISNKNTSNELNFIKIEGEDSTMDRVLVEFFAPESGMSGTGTQFSAGKEEKVNTPPAAKMKGNWSEGIAQLDLG